MMNQWQVIENAGKDNQKVVAEFRTYDDAAHYLYKHYPDEWNRPEGAGILKNGSAEY